MTVPLVRLNSGVPIYIDHTPVGAVTGGDVVVLNDVPTVAPVDIAAGALGAVSPRGGVYRMPKAVTSGDAIDEGKKVFWNAASSEVQETASTHKLFGYTAEDSADADTHVLVVHEPEATP